VLSRGTVIDAMIPAAAAAGCAQCKARPGFVLEDHVKVLERGRRGGGGTAESVGVEGGGRGGRVSHHTDRSNHAGKLAATTPYTQQRQRVSLDGRNANNTCRASEMRCITLARGRGGRAELSSTVCRAPLVVSGYADRGRCGVLVLAMGAGRQMSRAHAQLPCVVQGVDVPLVFAGSME